MNAKHITRIRVMQPTDLAQVLLIEQASYDYPWSQGIFLGCLDKPNYHCFVMESDTEICGYAVFSITIDEGHLLNMCIASKYRRAHLGTSFLRYLIDFAKDQFITQIFLEVRSTNQAALSLYQQLGFEMVATRENYYPSADGREDANIMVYVFD